MNMSLLKKGLNNFLHVILKCNVYKYIIILKLILPFHCFTCLISYKNKLLGGMKIIFKLISKMNE